MVKSNLNINGKKGLNKFIGGKVRKGEKNVFPSPSKGH
jgi:hypothetical protein